MQRCRKNNNITQDGWHAFSHSLIRPYCVRFYNIYLREVSIYTHSIVIASSLARERGDPVYKLFSWIAAEVLRPPRNDVKLHSCYSQLALLPCNFPGMMAWWMALVNALIAKKEGTSPSSPLPLWERSTRRGG